MDGIGFDKLPPHDIEAEKCLIASMMLDESGIIIPQVKGIVSRNSFYQADHQVYFDALLSMHAASKPIDLILLRDELLSRKLFEEVGGNGYLAEIVNKVPSATHGVHYANIVREKYMLRGIIQVSNEALRRVYSPLADPASAAHIAQELYGSLASIACTGEAEAIHRLSDVAARVLMSRDDKSVTRLPTGLMELDDSIGGIAKGRFTQIGGRPAMGKSLACKQIVLNIAKKGIPCGIVSVEETEEKIAQNYLSNISGIENQRIVYNTLIEQEVNELIGAMTTIDKLPIFIADSPVKLSEIESCITALVMEHKCEVVVVDYLQLISLDEPTENENREITRISKSLKSTFKKLNIAGLVPVQLNRGNETGGVRKPALRDLRGSGSLEQDGDLIILLHREDYYHKGEENYDPNHQIEAIIAKNKDGPTATIPLYFDPRTQRIDDWEKRPQQQHHNPFESGEAA